MKSIVSNKLAQYGKDVDQIRDEWLAQGVEESARQRYHFTDPDYYVFGRTYSNSTELAIEDPVNSVEDAKKTVGSELEDWVYQYEEMWVEECWPDDEGGVDRDGCNLVTGGTIFEPYDDGTGVFYSPTGEEIDIPSQWFADGKNREMQQKQQQQQRL